MYEITVDAPSKSYKVTVSNGFLGDIGERIKPLLSSLTVAIVTDSVVSKIYLSDVSASLARVGVSVKTCVIAYGEKSKNVENYIDLLRFLSREGFTRSDAVIALGGGVVGDLAGFAASTYMRGIKFINIATTLLSGIDSSVGGKTAIDLAEGKNLVGTFYQPEAVFFDVETLNTLPDREMNNGYGELIKCGILCGGELWDILKSGDKKNNKDLARAIALAIEYKRDVVVADEREIGKRRLLNLGHTMAHAIEKLSEYSIPHGEAVAMGLKMILDASLKRHYLNISDYTAIIGVLSAYSLLRETLFSIKELANAAQADKKVEGENISVVAVRGVGDCFIEKIPTSKIEEYFQA